MSRFRLARQADADLDAIADYIAGSSPSAAVREVERLYGKFTLLASHPLMGEACDHLRKGLRAFSAGNYVIFYVSREDGIEVERVLHGARDLESLF
jgi:toxin ParE1/3/4